MQSRGQAGFAKNDRVFVALVLMGLGFEAAVQLSPKPAPVLNEGCSDGNAEQDLESSSPGPAPESEDVPSPRVAGAYSSFWPVFGINVLPSTCPTPFPSHLSRQPVLSRRVDAAGLWSGFAPPPRDAFLGCFWEGLAHGQAGGPPTPSSELAGFGEKKEHLGAGARAGPCGSGTAHVPHVVWGQGLRETPGESRDLGSFGSSLSLAK